MIDIRSEQVISFAGIRRWTSLQLPQSPELSVLTA